MKIKDIITGSKPSLSFEVFPPKTSDKFDAVASATREIAGLAPDYMSVTFGAGGGTSAYTVEIAKRIKDMGITPLAHLTCASMTKEQIEKQIEELRENGIENILALRGDIPEDMKDRKNDFTYASELTEFIKSKGDFCVGGACYPECHVECESLSRDIENLKKKVDSGCEFLTTQMFFNNEVLYRFISKIRKAGIDVPVVAGVMPITNAAMIKRSCELSGAVLPTGFLQIIDRYGDNPAAMTQAGIAYATEQIIDLYANGINAVHVYSMNKPEVAREILDNISEIVK